jgi:N-acetylmuramic acid 6-phosphate etherase
MDAAGEVENKRRIAAEKPKPRFYVPEFDPATSPTEIRNPRSRNLHKLSAVAGVELMLREEARVGPALLRQKNKIARAVRMATDTLRGDGRIFYVGAGTSGRLGILDASECPPTFRADPEMIQGIIAGGQQAIWQAVEGAEDDPQAGADALRYRGVRSRDLVIGIAASGRTPFVWGALAEAKKHRAKTIFLCFNPALKIDPNHRPDLLIAPDLGPEVLTGSTRLKAGTATKLILNAISTLAMVANGKVVSNLMIDLNPSNIKLRDRATRIVSELSDTDYETARAALESNGWIVKKAWEELKRHSRGRAGHGK